jgi:hypothetical protein
LYFLSLNTFVQMCDLDCSCPQDILAMVWFLIQKLITDNVISQPPFHSEMWKSKIITKMTAHRNPGQLENSHCALKLGANTAVMTHSLIRLCASAVCRTVTLKPDIHNSLLFYLCVCNGVSYYLQSSPLCWHQDSVSAMLLIWWFAHRWRCASSRLITLR